MGLGKERDGLGGGREELDLRDGNGKLGEISEEIMAGEYWNWRKSEVGK